MPSRANVILKRLRSLEEGEGLRRASLVSRILFFVGVLAAMFIGCAVTFRWHPVLIAVAGAIVGYIIAERAALRSRILQWPIFRTYIDWHKVDEDLKRDV
jgi:hypothetical protein